MLPTFIRQVRCSPVTPVIGSGQQRVQPIWVDDVAAYFAAAVDAPEAANRIFELGGPDVVDAGTSSTRGSRRCSASAGGAVHVPTALARTGATADRTAPRRADHRATS